MMRKWLFTVLLLPLLAHAAPVLEGSNTSSESSLTTSHTVNLPASISSGEMLGVCFAYENDIASPNPTISGWTRVANSVRDPGGALAVFVKEATGSEGATVTVDTTGESVTSAHYSFRLSGADTTIPTGTAVSDNNGVDANPDASAVTVTSGDYFIVACTAVDNNRTFSVTPSGYTNTGDLQSSGTAADSVTLGYASTTFTGTSEDPGAWTSSSLDDWRAVAVAFEEGGSTVTFNQSNYGLDDLMEVTATGYTGTLATLTLTGGDTISPEVGASSSDADYTTKALSEYTSSGSANNTQWGVVLTGTIGPDDATDTFTIDAPATSSDFFFDAACASASCPTDSLIHSTNGVSTTQDVAVNDDVYCRFTSGSGTINSSGVPMFSGNAVIECRRFKESTTSWGDADSLSFTVSSAECTPKDRQAWRSVLNQVSRLPVCVPLY